MKPQLNEFKISSLRNFGTQNVSFTATVYSENMTLTDEEIAAQVKQIDKVVELSFRASQEQTISEKGITAEYSKRRTAAIEEADKALSDEIEASKKAGKTLAAAEKASDKIQKGSSKK